MSLVLDEYKGFCIDHSVNNEKHSGVITTGIDSLPSYSSIIASEQETTEVAETLPESKKTKQQKRLEKQQKKIRISQRKLKQRLQKVPEATVEVKTTAQPLIRTQIKKIYSKLAGKEETKLIQYGSVALYTTDLDQILPGEWINDNIISLVYEYLTETVLEHHKKYVKLISPAVVQLISFTEHDILDSKDFKSCKFIFLPVNETEEGDHWFLMVFNILEQSILVYDSMMDDSDTENKLLINKIVDRLAKQGIISNRMKVKYTKIEQQSNFDDCGVYLIMISCYIANMLINQSINFDLSDIKFDPLKGRLDIMHIINHLVELSRMQS